MSVAKRQTKNSGSGIPLVVGAVSIALAVILFLNRQYVIDQFAVWQYQPTAVVASIVSRTQMSDTGKFYFYASSPAIESAEGFNKSCRGQEEGTAILGCYTGRHIYVYDVTNNQLDGIEEVTAAHEMLHAAYDRLSSDEKKKIDTLVEAEFEKLRHDAKFAERMAYYDRTEPGERDNELHSIIGTEIPTINGELESHYKRYFSDRSKIVALHESYAGVFRQLEARSQELASELTSLADTINAETANYNEAIKILNKDIASFNERANGGEFSSQSEFQAERAILVARSDALEVIRTRINQDVDHYNELRAELAAVASESEALNRSIDSTLAPAPSV
jgi:flagellin-like hook-associated protein FlgL